MLLVRGEGYAMALSLSAIKMVYEYFEHETRDSEAVKTTELIELVLLVKELVYSKLTERVFNPARLTNILV